MYRTNNLNLNLPYKLHKDVITKDHVPTAEELSWLIDIADIGGKLIVAMLPKEDSDLEHSASYNTDTYVKTLKET